MYNTGEIENRNFAYIYKCPINEEIRPDKLKNKTWPIIVKTINEKYIRELTKFIKGCVKLTNMGQRKLRKWIRLAIKILELRSNLKYTVLYYNILYRAIYFTVYYVMLFHSILYIMLYFTNFIIITSNVHVCNRVSVDSKPCYNK